MGNWGGTTLLSGAYNSIHNRLGPTLYLYAIFVVDVFTGGFTTMWKPLWVDFGGGNILVFRGWGADKPGICQAVRGGKSIRKVEFWKKNLTWLVGFNDFLCSSPFGEMIQFDWYFSDGLKPPTIVTCWTQKLVLCVDVSPFPLGVNQPFVFRGRASWILLDLFKLMFYGFYTMVNHHFSPTFGESCFDRVLTFVPTA